MEIIQNILVFIAVIFAFGVLYYKFFNKKQHKKSCGSGDCGCN